MPSCNSKLDSLRRWRTIFNLSMNSYYLDKQLSHLGTREIFHIEYLLKCCFVGISMSVLTNWIQYNNSLFENRELILYVKPILLKRTYLCSFFRELFRQIFVNLWHIFDYSQWIENVMKTRHISVQTSRVFIFLKRVFHLGVNYPT